MKVAAIGGLVLLTVATIVGRCLSGSDTMLRSKTGEFAIDGREFLVADPPREGLSLVAQELAKRGIDMRAISRSLHSELVPASAERLSERPASDGGPALPHGFVPEHVLRLNTGGGPVEIAFGRITCGEKTVIKRLRSSGWECRESNVPESFRAFAQLSKGKETSVVLLGKSEGSFLAIRRAFR